MATTTHKYPAKLYSPMQFLKGEKFSAAVTFRFNDLYEGSVAGASIGDLVQVIPTVKGLLVTDLFTRVDVPSGAVGTAMVGDASDANGYDAAINPSAAAGVTVKSLEATDPYGIGRLYTSNDLTINVSIATSNIVSGTLTMIAEGVVLEQYA